MGAGKMKGNGVPPRKVAVYSDGATEVRVGDVVKRWGLLGPKRGKVTYVPGISPQHREMEDDRTGIRYVGIQLDRGRFAGAMQDPYSGRLLWNIRFIARGEPENLVKPEDVLFEDGG